MSEKTNMKPINYYIKERATYDAMLAAGEIVSGNIYYIEDTGEILVFDGVFGGGVTADSVLSDESENPVQNKVIKAALDNLTKEVVDNEEVTAAALTDLDKRVSKKQDVLIDGENIKTINGESILGKGNIKIQGGGGNIDEELLEGFIPLSREFSDDFNNDFAR